jgi:hypothetical protein
MFYEAALFDVSYAVAGVFAGVRRIYMELRGLVVVNLHEGDAVCGGV